MKLCQFHMTHSVIADLHVFYPHCGCGWIGEPGTFDRLPSADEVRSVAWRWERHRQSWASHLQAERKMSRGLAI